jgi:hypothetical protein
MQNFTNPQINKKTQLLITLMGHGNLGLEEKTKLSSKNSNFLPFYTPWLSE